MFSALRDTRDYTIYYTQMRLYYNPWTKHKQDQS